jgi:TPR repeat protein
MTQPGRSSSMPPGAQPADTATPPSAAAIAATTAEELARLRAGPPQAYAAWMRGAAEQGLVEAQAIYAQMLLDGAGVARDAAAALTWFKRAAHAGHAMAMNMVGRCYENGWGIAADDMLAAYWFRLAADRGLDWALYNYAHMLRAGRGGVARDPAAALAMYQRAADMGHAKSIGVVGRFHEEGDIVPRDLERAFDCYRRCAEGGDFRGMFHYARLLLERGQREQAETWLRRVPQTATPAFMEAAHAMLLAGPAPELARLYEPYLP